MELTEKILKNYMKYGLLTEDEQKLILEDARKTGFRITSESEIVKILKSNIKELEAKEKDLLDEAGKLEKEQEQLEIEIAKLRLERAKMVAKSKNRRAKIKENYDQVELKNIALELHASLRGLDEFKQKNDQKINLLNIQKIRQKLTQK
jgi:hypothetical protein